MAKLKIFGESSCENFELIEDFSEIQAELARISVKLDRWYPKKNAAELDSADEILDAFSEQIERLKSERGFLTQDVISISPDHPNKNELREKFLSEHTHNDDEARYFVDGTGLFYVHSDAKVYGIVCEKGDLINIPKGTQHWFDMGPNPNFTCIRVFTNPDGWVAQFTDSSIAKEFPLLG